MKVLVVEDQAAVAQALCVLPRLNGIPCASVAAPEAALAALDDGDVDLVIQDMNFSPGATSGEEGMRLFRRLRARRPGLPVLVLTAWTSLDTAVQMMKDGASDYLGKPWDDQRLLAAVRALLKAGEAQRGAASSPSWAQAPPASCRRRWPPPRTRSSPWVRRATKKRTARCAGRSRSTCGRTCCTSSSASRPSSGVARSRSGSRPSAS